MSDRERALVVTAPTRPAEGPRYPGTPVIIDGSEAVARIETRITEGCCAYPITPSTTMAAIYQKAVADGRTDLWGTPLRFLEPESEHSSATAAEGFALAGGRVTNFTAGQGLILMKEVLHVISGKRLPVVFHVGARALTSQALNIHAGHDDVMGVADSGWGILFARNAQEAADLAAIARRVAEDTQTPFIVAQDGFLTTHTLERVALPEDELLRDFVGDPRERIRDLFDPAEALMSGVVQNQDAYMKGRIGQRVFTAALIDDLRGVMAEWGELTGRSLDLIEPHRTDDAERVVVAMGSMADTTIAVVDHLRRQGQRVGCVAVTAFRPFPAAALAQALGRADAVAVLERTDEPTAAWNPLTREIRAALYDAAAGARPRIVSGSAGLGSRDVAAGDIAAVFEALNDPSALDRLDRFVLGIRHPAALAPLELELRTPGTFSLRGHSIGGFGSVTTNRLLATICGELFDAHVQAYPRYGSEKKGLPTTYFLTIADDPIRSHGELREVDLVAVHDAAAFRHGAPLLGLVDGGTVFLHSPLDDAGAILASLPAGARREAAERHIRIIALDTLDLARRHAPRPQLAARMQGAALVGVFLRVAPFADRHGLDEAALFEALRPVLARTFGHRGDDLVEANLALMREAYRSAIDVTASAIGTAGPNGDAASARPPVRTAT